MKLYLVRHGESEANKLHLHSTPETELTKEGIKQAKVLANRLKHTKIDFIYSSTHRRTIQTASEISKKLDLPIEEWDQLIEVRTPSVSWGKPRHDKNAAKIEAVVDQNYISGQKHSDEETFKEIKARSLKMLDHLLSKHAGQNILVVSHASFIKMTILAAILGEKLTPQIFLNFRNHSRMNNSGISILEYGSDHGWVLNSWNDMSHL